MKLSCLLLLTFQSKTLSEGAEWLCNLGNLFVTLVSVLPEHNLCVSVFLQDDEKKKQFKCTYVADELLFMLILMNYEYWVFKWTQNRTPLPTWFVHNLLSQAAVMSRCLQKEGQKKSSYIRYLLGNGEEDVEKMKEEKKRWFLFYK